MNENRGCKFGGQFNVNKVPGNFHISTHSVSTKDRFISIGFGPFSIQDADSDRSRLEEGSMDR